MSYAIYEPTNKLANDMKVSKKMGVLLRSKERAIIEATIPVIRQSIVANSFK